MPADETPERDRALQEAWRARVLQQSAPDEPRYFTLINVLVILLGFTLAFGLALLVMQP